MNSKKILPGLLVVLAATYSLGVTAMETVPLTIVVNNVKEVRAGQLTVFVFLKEGFPKEHEKAIFTFSRPVDHQRMPMNISVPLLGPFAIKILHDENMDGKVTKNWTGIIPRDGIGFSNGARIGFGPPNFDDAKVSDAKNLGQTFELQYF